MPVLVQHGRAQVGPQAHLEGLVGQGGHEIGGDVEAVFVDVAPVHRLGAEAGVVEVQAQVGFGPEVLQEAQVAAQAELVIVVVDGGAQASVQRPGGRAAAGDTGRPATRPAGTKLGQESSYAPRAARAGARIRL